MAPIRSNCAVAAVLDPIDERMPTRRGSLIATYALLLEAARRPALQAVARRWGDAYLEVVGRLLEAAGSTKPAADAELLMAAADGLLIEQLATGDRGELSSRLCWLATALVKRT